MRYLNAQETREALAMNRAIAAMHEAFSDDVEFPQRVLLARSLFMPGRVGVVSGIKVVSTVPGSPVGTVVVFDEGGVPVGMVDGPTLTAIRTGAGAGLATELLAPESASVLAMLGAGAMAYDQIAAVAAVRPISEIRIWSRTRARAEALAGRFATAHAVGAPEEAVNGADIISTATPARAPLFAHSAVGGARVHVNAVGAFTPEMAEIPPDLVRASFCVVDDRQAAAEEAGDLLQAGVAPHATMADLLEHRVEVPAGSTLFKSVGIASQDVAAAMAALGEAEASGIGTTVG